jgi:hypothetical protein
VPRLLLDDMRGLLGADHERGEMCDGGAATAQLINREPGKAGAQTGLAPATNAPATPDSASAAPAQVNEKESGGGARAAARKEAGWNPASLTAASVTGNAEVVSGYQRAVPLTQPLALWTVDLAALVQEGLSAAVHVAAQPPPSAHSSCAAAAAAAAVAATPGARGASAAHQQHGSHSVPGGADGCSGARSPPAPVAVQQFVRQGRAPAGHPGGGGGALMVQAAPVAAGVLNAVVLWAQMATLAAPPPSGDGTHARSAPGTAGQTGVASNEEIGVARFAAAGAREPPSAKLEVERQAVASSTGGSSGGGEAEGAAKPACGVRSMEALLYTRHIAGGAPGSPLQLVVQRGGGGLAGLVIDVRPSTGAPAPLPPWKVWGGGMWRTA